MNHPPPNDNRPIIRAALIDISGTLHIGNDAIPGAIVACRRLLTLQKTQQPNNNNNNFKVLFLTNTSQISTTSLLSTLRSIGFDEDAIPSSEHIMTSVGATRRYLLEKELRPYCLLEDDLLSTDFHNLGVDTIRPALLDSGDNNDEDESGGPNCVLVGLAPNKFNYERLNTAYRLLNRLKSKDDKCRREADAHEQQLQQTPPPPRLIAIHRAMHYRDSDRILSLGPGGFISLLEQASGVSAHVIGKPSTNFYHEALSYLGIDDPAHAIMVGDDVVGDIGGALRAGLGGAVLVKTGKYVHGDESGRKTEGMVPTLTVNSIVEAVDFIICSQHS